MPTQAGPLQDIIMDIKQNAIEQFDYSPAFPTTNIDGTAYLNPRGPIFVDGWPWQLERQMEVVTNQGQMTQPIISIFGLHFADEDRTLGDIYQAGVGSGPLQLRLGRRANPSVLISCWANQQLGGMNMCRKLGGYVFSAVFYYRNSLTTIRGLRVTSSHESFSDASLLYRVDLTVTGRSLIVMDV